MRKLDKIKQQLDKAIYTAAAVLLICVVFVTSINHTYRFSEGESFEKLHMETQQIKNSINNQIISDRENLQTMANFASKLYSNGESYELLFDSFKEIGLFENIGILLPDNRFITKMDTLNLSGKISFDDEAQLGEYVSGRVKDLTNDEKEIIRSAVPIKTADGSTVAIIYGVINIEKFEQRYAAMASSINAQLYVIEGNSGKYIIDTRHEIPGSVTTLTSSSYKNDFSYDKMIEELSESTEGYAAFMDNTGDEYLYAHYAPLEIGDWQIMLTQPESVVFAGAKATGKYLSLIAATIVLIMIAYIVLIFSSEKKAVKISSFASTIRKSLLEVNQHIDKVHDALQAITDFSKSRSSFIIDTYDEAYYHIIPSQKDNLLREEEREYFNTKLLNYAARHRTEHGAALYLSKITADRHLCIEMPDFYKFLKAHNIANVNFAIVINNNSNTYVLGVINPKRYHITELLKEIAVCFSMALYNKKHLARTETMALTDPLTGVANRMAYKRETKLMNLSEESEFACIYIDVNELHYFNDKYGHAAGDQMLVFIAEVLVKEFSECRIYRMGGDEFLVIAESLLPDDIEERINNANIQIEEMKYHISVGIAYGDTNFDIEETVIGAEKLMYAEKAKYYQSKEQRKVIRVANRTMKSIETGIKEVDAVLSIMSERYVGLYCVSHKDDNILQVLIPSYFSAILDEAGSFSASMRKYIYDIVRPEYRRTLLSFLEYDVLEKQLKNGQTPRASYTKIDGERITLSIHPVRSANSEGIDSIWIFEKGDFETK